MKKLLILVMVFSLGLAGIVSADPGKFNYRRWNNGNTGTSVLQYQRDLTTAPTNVYTVDAAFTFPDGTTGKTTGLETPAWANGDNYAARFDGWFVPPIDGSYKFWITSDDGSELWLSQDDTSSNWFGGARIANVSSWTNQRQWDSRILSRRSQSP
jgi:hypothetical protein